MKDFFLGIDVGATKSHALIADSRGRVLGFSRGGSGNYEVVGWEGLRSVLQRITGEALRSAGIDSGQIAGAGFGIAGYDWPSEREPTLEVIRTLDLAAPFEAVNDSIIGLIAGAPQGWGIAIIAGTGENCWGRDREHRFGRMTGNSIYMEEYGGASSIVYKAIGAVAREWGRRGPPTRLSAVFLQHFQAESLDELLEGFAVGRYSYGAELAPVVFKTAGSGDTVARGIIHWAAEGLADMVVGVSRQLSFEDLAFDVVMIGSVFKGGDMILDPLKAAVQAVAPGANFIRLGAPPVVGGVLLGMEQAGLDAGPVVRQRLCDSAAAIIRELE